MSCITTLQRNGLKLTPQRRAIVDIIHSTEAHLTAEDIIASVQRRIPGVNKSTIYRNLELLEKTGCVFRSELGDRSIYHHAEDRYHHHHLVCRHCGKTIDCDEYLFAAVEKAVANKYGFKTDLKHAVISGLCQECQRKAN